MERPFPDEAEGEQQAGLSAAHTFKEKRIANHDEDSHDLVALCRIPGPVVDMEQGEQDTGKESRQPVIRQSDHDHGESEETKQGEIVDAPCQVTRAEEMHGPPLYDVDAGHVDVRDVAIGGEAVVHQEVDVMKNLRVPDQRPAIRENDKSNRRDAQDGSDDEPKNVQRGSV